MLNTYLISLKLKDNYIFFYIEGHTSQNKKLKCMKETKEGKNSNISGLWQ